MAQTLNMSSRRWLRNGAPTVICILALSWILSLYGASLRQHKFLDGWVLIACVLGLAGFNLRKKLSMLPLGPAATWTQMHLYVGYFTVFAFLFHTEFSIPKGVLDWALWALFLTVAVSGVLGAYLSRAVPPKLEQGVERILLERIPGFRAQLAGEVAELAMQSVADETSLTLSNFYADTLHDFMGRPRNLISHIRGSQRPLRRICDDLDKLRRYLDKKGVETLEQIKELVVAKDNLDFNQAHLGLLRLWLFVHIPATYSLVMLVVVHLAAVYAFSSGAP